MDSSPLISVEELSRREPGIVVLDCRFELSDKGAGRRAYDVGHLPGALFVDLEDDLSDMRQVATRGRHPLPTDRQLSAVLSRLGVNANSELVCYDAADGMFAARAWWLFSHSTQLRVRVLDGGLKEWLAAGHSLTMDKPQVETTDYRASLSDDAWIATDKLTAFLKGGVLLDARAAPRFRGEVEPIDPIAGHVPGAVNAPFGDNLRNGKFKPAEELAERFAPLIKPGAHRVAHMCGSGVTACHNLLAMEVAGYRGSCLYADSWSGWITDRSRAIALGSA